MDQEKQCIPLYPILLAGYPILALYAANITEISAASLWRPLVICMISGILFLLVFRLLLRDWHRAALLTAALQFFLFSYGHVYISLKSVAFLVPFVRHRILLPVWVLLAAAILWTIFRMKRVPATAARILNLTAVIALIFPLFQIGRHFYSSARFDSQAAYQSHPELQLPADQRPPDIYYIILDAYGNTATLRNKMNFDNTGFLQALRDQGFYIAECSQSNYSGTSLSLVSSLNMNYLSEFGDAFQPGSTDRTELAGYLKSSEVREALELLGYQTVAYETGFYWSQWMDADLYLSPEVMAWYGITEFEDLFIKTTLVRALYDMDVSFGSRGGTSPHYERVFYVLNSLPSIPSIPGPKFVFVHLIIPHDPFDIGPAGEFIGSWSSSTEELYNQGYSHQVEFISGVLPGITAAILENSATEPIIIIQGDHGPAFYHNDLDRMGILNAYYLPQGWQDLYSTITPVNTFRIVFNRYFGGQFPLLEDVSYISEADDPFTGTEVPNPCSP